MSVDPRQPIGRRRAAAMIAEAQRLHGDAWEHHIERALYPAERLYLLSRARDERKHWIDVLLDEADPRRRENPIMRIPRPVHVAIGAAHGDERARDLRRDLARRANPGLRLVPAKPRRSSRIIPRFDDDPGMQERGLDAVVREAAAALGVAPGGKAYGCGQYGCAAPTSDARVLKVTVDLAEARWAWAAHRARETRGFAEIDVPPHRLWPLQYGGYAYGYVREAVEPLRGRAIGKKAMALLEDIEVVARVPAFGSGMFYPEQYEEERRERYVMLTKELARTLPDVAASMLALAELGELTYDVHPPNLGRRDGAIVLFDGRINASLVEDTARFIAYKLETMRGTVELFRARGEPPPRWTEEPEQHIRSELSHVYYVHGSDDALWAKAWPLGQALLDDPNVFFKGRRGNPLPLLAGVAALFMAMPITPTIAGVAAYRARNNRKKNPLRLSAFAGHYKGGEFELSPIVAAANKAEKMFGVRLRGSLYGCGDMGCAAELEDGRVLKLTTDEHEAAWARLAHDLRLPGTVHVFTEPVVVGVAEWKHGFGPPHIYAFVREAAKDVPSALWNKAHWQQHLLEDVDKARQVLAARGYLLTDTKHENMGVNAAGEIVVRDGRALR